MYQKLHKKVYGEEATITIVEFIEIWGGCKEIGYEGAWFSWCNAQILRDACGAAVAASSRRRRSTSPPSSTRQQSHAHIGARGHALTLVCYSVRTARVQQCLTVMHYSALQCCNPTVIISDDYSASLQRL